MCWPEKKEILDETGIKRAFYIFFWLSENRKEVQPFSSSKSCDSDNLLTQSKIKQYVFLAWKMSKLLVSEINPIYIWLFITYESILKI